MPKLNKSGKQITFDDLPEKLFEKPKPLPRLEKTKQKSQIKISNISLDLDIKNDELILKVDFSLLPSKAYFSKLKADLWFDSLKVKSVLFNILHSFGSTDEFALKTSFDPNGVETGTHTVKVELHEISSIRKNLAYTAKEATLDYHPPSREERLRKVLTVKKVEGKGISIVSENEKDIFKEIEETMKKDLISKQDKW